MDKTGSGRDARSDGRRRSARRARRKRAGAGVTVDGADQEAEGPERDQRIPVAIDAQSSPYCEGATIDYFDETAGPGGFVVTNERFGGGCSCGK